VVIKLVESKAVVEEYQSLLEKLIIVNKGQKFGQVVLMGGGAGCYPKGTEFFSDNGWKNIEDYEEGDKVLQIDPENLKGNLVAPDNYVEIPLDKFINIRNKKVNFTTSLDHKHLVINEKTKKKEIKRTYELFEKHNKNVSLINTFDYAGNGIDHTDDDIRLKINNIKDQTEEGNELENYWYDCDKHQQKIVMDEILREDIVPSSTSEQSIKVIQFIFASNGIIADFTFDGTVYTLLLNDRSENITSVSKMDKQENEMMYCFTVDSGFFAVRQNNQIYVSGNSGKGFSIKNFTNMGDSYRVLDVDAIKATLLKINKLTGKYPELKGLDLRTPGDVSTLHHFVAKERDGKTSLQKSILQDTLGNAILSADPRRKPNLLFDKTLKTMKELKKVIKMVEELGYDKKDIHVIWTMTDFRVAMSRNLKRSRIVPEDILMGTHEGAAKTMFDLIKSFKSIRDIFDGEFYVINNNEIPGNVFNKPAFREFIKKTNEGIISERNVAENKFKYLRLKKAGKDIEFTKRHETELMQWLSDNIPRTKETAYIFDYIKTNFPKVKI